MEEQEQKLKDIAKNLSTFADTKGDPTSVIYNAAKDAASVLSATDFNPTEGDSNMNGFLQSVHDPKDVAYVQKSIVVPYLALRSGATSDDLTAIRNFVAIGTTSPASATAKTAEDAKAEADVTKAATEAKAAADATKAAAEAKEAAKAKPPAKPASSPSDDLKQKLATASEKGPKAVIEFVQGVLGVPKDGKFGDKSLGAYKKIKTNLTDASPDQKALVEALGNITGNTIDARNHDIIKKLENAGMPKPMQRQSLKTAHAKAPPRDEVAEAAWEQARQANETYLANRRAAEEAQKTQAVATPQTERGPLVYTESGGIVVVGNGEGTVNGWNAKDARAEVDRILAARNAPQGPTGPSGQPAAQAGALKNQPTTTTTAVVDKKPATTIASFQNPSR